MQNTISNLEEKFNLQGQANELVKKARRVLEYSLPEALQLANRAIEIYESLHQERRKYRAVNEFGSIEDAQNYFSESLCVKLYQQKKAA